MLLPHYAWLIPLAPLAAALLTALPARPVSERRYRIGAFAHAVAFGLAVLVLIRVAAPDQGTIRLTLFPSPWTFLPSFELAIDRLAAVMMVLIAGIGTLLYVYSIGYMQQESGRARYQTLLALTISTLLCMVSSANLVMLFVFWQFLSWLLCLLTYNYAHAPTARGAFRTFLILRVGDGAFLLGIVLAYHLYGTLDFSQLFLRAAADQMTLSLFWAGSGLQVQGATAVTLLIFIGAMSKSAQVPLHRWVPDTLYAPTPVSALLHAGIINAGGFLLNRLAPLYGLSAVTLHVVFAVGLLTALVGACLMLTQNDIKKTLGYSTVGQMGYMVMECGLGAFALAVFHLIAHGLFKATSFLNSGNVIHLARREYRRPDQGHTTGTDFSPLTWATGFLTSLVLPLVIVLAAHGVVQIPLQDAQGAVVFLFFSWVTSSQAILTLYRVRAVGSWKVAGVMLLTLVFVMSTYLLAAERFTHFLYPDPALVTAYFQAAALPGGLFEMLIATTALAITLGWFVIYAKSHGRSVWTPGQVPAWFGRVQERVYVFFVNNAYLDGLALRVGGGIRGAVQGLERSRLPLLVGAFIAASLIWLSVVEARAWSIGTLARWGLTVLLLPLFPFHTVYTRVLTLGGSRTAGAATAGYVSIGLAGALPLLGLYGLAGLLPDLTPEFLRSVGALALLGVLYASLRALMQVQVERLLAYGSVAFYSILWWQVAVTGRVASETVVYAGSVALVTVGMLLAWNRVRARYGDLDASRIGGLARPMPRLATLLGLLVMAGVGLPPFGLFSGYIALLLDPLIGVSYGTSVGLTVVVLAWVIASWYLFKLMQRLLMGPHRADLRYEDLSRAEAAPLVVVLALLLAIGILPDELAGLVGAAQ